LQKIFSRVNAGFRPGENASNHHDSTSTTTGTTFNHRGRGSRDLGSGIGDWMKGKNHQPRTTNHD
jgi:hypothetical protein